MAHRKPTTARRKGFGAAGFFLVLLILAMGAAGAAAWLVLTPYGPQGETIVEVAPGSSTVRIGRQLQGAGIVRSEYAFDVVRFWKRGTLKAGAYRFDHPAPASEVYDRIQRGDVYTIAVTVPEGASIFDIADRLQQAGFGQRQAFLDMAVQESSLIADLDPTAKSLEGYLFPDTYRFAPRTALPEIAATMVKRFRREAAELGLSINVHRTVTLASLVERETAVDAERPLVASVFENRLAKKMPLMTDPSVIYGLELEAVAGHALRMRPEARYALQHLSSCRPASGSGGESGREVSARGDGADEDRLSLLCGRRRQSAGQVGLRNHGRGA